MAVVRRTERGWPGHFICAPDCRFRRNTLLECEGTRIVVSTVGNMFREGKEVEEIGYERYFETMAFHAQYDGRFWDADVSKEISFWSPWSIGIPWLEDAANDMHEEVVKEVSQRLESGETFPARREEDENLELTEVLCEK